MAARSKLLNDELQSALLLIRQWINIRYRESRILQILYILLLHGELQFHWFCCDLVLINCCFQNRTNFQDFYWSLFQTEIIIIQAIFRYYVICSFWANLVLEGPDKIDFWHYGARRFALNFSIALCFRSSSGGYDMNHCGTLASCGSDDVINALCSLFNKTGIFMLKFNWIFAFNFIPQWFASTVWIVH